MKDKPILIYLLFTLFLGLKLAGEITWSWIWVFAPLWGFALLTLAIGFAVGFKASYRRARHQAERLKQKAELRAKLEAGGYRTTNKAENRPDVH